MLITDATMESLVDELQTHVPQLRTLSDALQCQVCYSYFNGPVQLRCGHAFCSVCIRKDLAFKHKAGHVQACPICRASALEDDITPCHQLREAVAAFKTLLPPLKQFIVGLQARDKANAAPPHHYHAERAAFEPKKRSRAHQLVALQTTEPDVVQLEDDDTAVPVRHARELSVSRSSDEEVHASKRRNPKNPVLGPALLHGEPAGPDSRQDLELPEDAPSRPSSPGAPAQASIDRGPVPGGLVRCPVCGILIRQDLINTHIDHCLTRGQPARQSNGGAGTRPRHSNHQRQQPPAPLPPPQAPQLMPRNEPRTRPPHALIVQDLPGKLVFNVLKDKELKARLKQVGLPADGTREELADRYQAYRLYLQAKLDAGTTLGLPQLRDSFLAQQRQQQAARRASPALTAAVAQMNGLMPGRGTVGVNNAGGTGGGTRSSASPDVFEIQGDQVVLTRPGRPGAGGSGGGVTGGAQPGVDTGDAFSFKGLIAQARQRAGKAHVGVGGSVAVSSAGGLKSDPPFGDAVSAGGADHLPNAAGTSAPGSSPAASPPPALEAGLSSGFARAFDAQPGGPSGMPATGDGIAHLTLPHQTPMPTPTGSLTCAVGSGHAQQARHVMEADHMVHPGQTGEVDMLQDKPVPHDEGQAGEGEGDTEVVGPTESEEGEADGQEGKQAGWMWSADTELDLDMQTELYRCSQ